jgi:DNA-binding MarR family transcriptional regulator
MFGKFERESGLEFQDNSITSSSVDIENRTGTAEKIYNLRRKRDSIFKTELFSDPAWDLLLDLYAAGCAQKTTSITDACLSAGTSPSTGLRWIAILVQNGYVERHDDPVNPEQSHLSLTPSARASLETLFEHFENEQN